MQTITHKLSDVARRIVESELRIDEQLQRMRVGSFDERADATRHCAVSCVQELRAYQARLEELVQEHKESSPRASALLH